MPKNPGGAPISAESAIGELLLMSTRASEVIDELVEALEPWPAASPATLVIDAVACAATWQEEWANWARRNLGAVPGE